MNLKELTEEAVKIAKKRHREEGLPITTLELLKYCAGELIEATEAYNKATYANGFSLDDFGDELADVMMCIIIVCGMKGIDVQKVLDNCLDKNYKRAFSNDSYSITPKGKSLICSMNHPV